MPAMPPVVGLLPSVGFGEWVILFVVLLVVYGPHRLPDLARRLGRLLAQWQRAADQLRMQFMAIAQEEEWSANNPYAEKDDTSSESTQKQGSGQNVIPDSPDAPSSKPSEGS